MINVSNNFHSAAFGQIIQPIVDIYVSFDKKISDGGFFTLNQSQLDGPDLLKFDASDAATQAWDFYDYKSFTDRLVSVSWERSLQFPYQIQSAMVDFTLSNTDGYFIPLNPDSPIGEVNIPARPFKLYAGFRYNDSTEMIPQVVGITDGLPDLNNGSKTVDYHGYDFFYKICNQSLTAVIDMRDARIDEVIAQILQSCGLSSAQYSLQQSSFVIPFVFFDIGASVGDALKKLVQAENGFMWLDETGVVRFETAMSMGGETETAATLTDYDVISLTPGELSNVVNHVKVTADIREVQEWQEVYVKSSSKPTQPGDVNASALWSVAPNGGTFTISCGLNDPCYDIVAPTLGRATSVSWFTAFTSNLDDVKSGVTCTGVLSSNSYTVTFTNNNSYEVNIDELKLWGEPAKIINVIDYDAYDDESVERYGDQTLEIADNQMFQSYDQANTFARTMIRQHKDYNRTLAAEVKGDFSFQLMDLVEINTSNDFYNGIYRVLGTSYSWDGRELITKLTLNGTNMEEGLFTLNRSQLDGKDLLG